MTPDRPSLDVIVEPGVSNLGTLSTEATGAKTLVVKIRSYLRRLRTTNQGHPAQIRQSYAKDLEYPVASIPVPSSSASTLPVIPRLISGLTPFRCQMKPRVLGTVAANYNQPNKFMYINGDTVASSSRESGETDFTITMIVNVANNTPAGNYVGDYSAVVIPIY